MLKKGKWAGYMGGIKIKYGGLVEMAGIYLKFHYKQKSAFWFTEFFRHILALAQDLILNQSQRFL